MKMLDKDYFAIDLPSYSKLATFDRVGPTMFEEKEVNLSKQAIRIGSLVDDILTDSNGISDKYFVIELDKPPASLGVLIDLCIAKFKSYDQITVPKVLTLAKENKLWISTKNEIKYIDKFDVDNFWNYLKMHYESEGRDLVSFETLKLAKTMANTLKEDIDTKDAFLDGDGIEVIYQHIEFWGEEPNDAYMLFGGEPPFKGYKSKFDILRIDHNNKTLQFVDIKTMMDKVGAFERSFYMFRYYIQDAMYQ
ncbi:MAG: hypothetical protein KAH32_06960, partial [Chlamydiia bacterium]|nr:hypothetical protein [Chlamydiia bacterium]